MTSLPALVGSNKLVSSHASRVAPVKVAAVPHPFRRERNVIELPGGGSIADIICAMGLNAAISARVFLEDRLVTQEYYASVYPKPGQILTIRAIATGGGRSKDVELLTIAVAAIAAVASYGAGAFITEALSAPVAAGATGAAGAAAATGPTLAGALAALAQGAIASSINFLGTQLINALIPPPRTPVPKQETTPHSYTVSGTANAAAPFSPIPKIYGARRIFPQYAASPYSELVGFDQYLRMLFLPGYGPLDISRIKIGDTAIEDYEDVEWELRSGFADDAPMRLYPGSVSEAELNIQLSKTNGGGIAPTVYDWSQVPVQTSGTNADELGVDMGFPDGPVDRWNFTGAGTVELIFLHTTRKHGLSHALLCLLLTGLREDPSLASRQVVCSRFFAFGREWRLADALDPQPPRRVSARAVRVAFARERQGVFSGRRQRRRRQPRHVNMSRGTACER